MSHLTATLAIVRSLFSWGDELAAIDLLLKVLEQGALI
jgi:hypothetical protein